MSDFNFGYNQLDDVEVHSGGRSLPDSGDYGVMLSSIDLVSSKSGNGHNLHVKYTIIDSDSDFAGAEIQEWLAVVNANETAQNIALSKLKAIYVVTGKQAAKNYKDLEGSVLRIRILKKENQYTDNNGNTRDGHQTEVNMYMDTSGKNASGKDVPAYTGPAVVASKGGKSQNRRPNVGNDPFGDSDQKSNDNFSSKYDDDDDIPF